jgi:hypothetical protein
MAVVNLKVISGVSFKMKIWSSTYPFSEKGNNSDNLQQISRIIAIIITTDSDKILLGTDE